MADILVLSSSALSDRMLLYSNALSGLRPHFDVRLWATSAASGRGSQIWAKAPAAVEPFPPVRGLKGFPHSFIRRLNDYAWDFHLRDPSRLSMMRHIRDKSQPWYMQMLKYPGKAIAATQLHQRVEDRLEKMTVAFDRIPAVSPRLQELRPDLVLSTGPFRYEEPAVAAAARRIGIPLLAFITSWDNISIKARLVLKYDGYLVWSERMKQELLEHYPHSRETPIYIVGAPQFDIFFRPDYYITREEFCAGLGLDWHKPVIVHAMGVANNVEEYFGAVDLASRVARGDLGDVQLIVRPHPFNNERELSSLLSRFAPRVVLQQHRPNEARNLRSQDERETVEWVNTFRHADVVVHLSSTVAVDAAIFDRPSVCMDYDPVPGQPRQAIVRDVNHRWTHYKPVVDIGGTRLVSDTDELVRAVLDYLEHPEKDRVERRRMAEYVCGFLDGRCGDRMAQAVTDFFRTHVRANSGALSEMHA